MKMRILVTIPVSPKEGICEYVSTMCQRLREDPRHDVDISYPCASPSEAARSVGLRAFWEGGYDFWLSIDSDNPPGVNPLDLIAFDLDLVGLPTPVHQHNSEGKATLRWNVYKRLPDGYAPLMLIDSELQEVDAIGSGCFLAARRIFEPKQMRRAPFARRWKKDGTVELGSDLAFCERVKKAGFKIYAHWAYLCNHFNVVNLIEMMQIQKAAWESGFEEGKRQCGISSRNSDAQRSIRNPSIPKAH